LPEDLASAALAWHLRIAGRAGHLGRPFLRGGGYAILFADGTVDADADFPRLSAPVQFVVGVYPANAIFTDDSGGFWVAWGNGAVYTYGDAPFDGSMLGAPLNGPIIAATGW